MLFNVLKEPTAQEQNANSVQTSVNPVKLLSTVKLASADITKSQVLVKLHVLQEPSLLATTASHVLIPVKLVRVHRLTVLVVNKVSSSSIINVCLIVQMACSSMEVLVNLVIPIARNVKALPPNVLPAKPTYSWSKINVLHNVLIL